MTFEELEKLRSKSFRGVLAEPIDVPKGLRGKQRAAYIYNARVRKLPALMRHYGIHPGDPDCMEKLIEVLAHLHFSSN